LLYVQTNIGATAVPFEGVEAIQLEKEFKFYSYHTTDRDVVARWHRQRRFLLEAAAPVSAALSSSNNNRNASASSTNSTSLSQDKILSVPPVAENSEECVSPAIVPIAPADAVLTQMGRSTVFKKFVPTCVDTDAVFEFCIDDLTHGGGSQGGRKR
jgi:hypothetical protein